MVFRGRAPLLVGEVPVPHGGDEGPVLPDRTTLQPGHAEVQCRELHPGNPDRGEEVPLAATDDDTAAHLVAEEPSDESAPDEKDDDEDDS